ncbi:hypothetical protein B7463_g2558, partial [Scytalidium lignicola]
MSSTNQGIVNRALDGAIDLARTATSVQADDAQYLRWFRDPANHGSIINNYQRVAGIRDGTTNLGSVNIIIADSIQSAIQAGIPITNPPQGAEVGVAATIPSRNTIVLFPDWLEAPDLFANTVPADPNSVQQISDNMATRGGYLLHELIHFLSRRQMAAVVAHDAQIPGFRPTSLPGSNRNRYLRSSTQVLDMVPRNWRDPNSDADQAVSDSLPSEADVAYGAELALALPRYNRGATAAAFNADNYAGFAVAWMTHFNPYASPAPEIPNLGSATQRNPYPSSVALTFQTVSNQLRITNPLTAAAIAILGSLRFGTGGAAKGRLSGEF